MLGDREEILFQSRDVEDISDSDAVGAEHDINGSMAKDWHSGSIGKMNDAMLVMCGRPLVKSGEEGLIINHVMGRSAIHNEFNQSRQGAGFKVTIPGSDEFLGEGN